MKAKFNFLISMLLLAFLLPVAAAADLNVTLTAPSPVAHNTDTSLSFTIQDLNTTYSNISNINYTIAIPSFSLNQITAISDVLTNGSVAVSKTSAAFKAPQYTVAGTYSGTLTVRGMLDGTVLTSTSTNFNINITSTPAITIAWISNPQSVSRGTNQTFAVNVSNSGNVNFNTLNLNASGGTGINLTFDQTPILNFNTGQSHIYNINMSTVRNAYYGTNTITVTANGTYTANNLISQSSASFDILYSYCSANSTSSRVYIDEINREDIEGDVFVPLDNIKLDVKVQNNYDEDRTVVVNSILVYKGSNLDDTEVEQTLNIGDGSSKTAHLNFTIPVDSNEGEYIVYVKAYDDDSSKYCDQEYIKFRVEKSTTHKLVLYDLKINQATYYQANVTCGSTIIVSGKIANVGTSDEEGVKMIYNDPWTKQLTKPLFDLNEGEETGFEFASNVPLNATEGSNSFTMTYYYAKDDDDNYDKSSNPLYSFTVSGNCVKTLANATITTEAASTEVFSGSESEVRVLVSNSGTISQTYTVEVPSVSWATIDSISPSTFTLSPGEIKYVSVKFTPAKDIATGAYTMDAKVSYAGTSQTKTLSLNVQKSSIVSSLADKLKFDANGSLIWYIIGALVVVIAVLWIIMSSSKRRIRSLKRDVNSEKVKQYKNY